MRKECIVWATKGFYGIFHSFNSVINASSVLTHLSAIRWISNNEWLIRNKQENLEKIQNLPKHRKNNGPNGFLKFKNSKYENLFTNSIKSEKIQIFNLFQSNSDLSHSPKGYFLHTTEFHPNFFILLCSNISMYAFFFIVIFIRFFFCGE